MSTVVLGRVVEEKTPIIQVTIMATEGMENESKLPNDPIHFIPIKSNARVKVIDLEGGEKSLIRTKMKQFTNFNNLKMCLQHETNPY